LRITPMSWSAGSTRPRATVSSSRARAPVEIQNASKARSRSEAARIWTAAGLGPVIGITPSQSARNTLAAGVPVSYNAARFLGHLPGRRGARGPVRIGPGTLLVIDEASMLSGPDLADLIAYARARGAKIILAGDISQLQAVENGGGMSLLTSHLGYARLAEPVRFRNQWEQAASLRLRDGDTTVLADYDQHARILGGDPEQMMDAAAAAYVALTASGTDTLLMAADHALRRELNRRIRDDLIALGTVHDGPAVSIADGTRASPGDLIICTRNDHRTEAGEPGRALANGDLLRIEAVNPKGLLVRRALDADPRTGQRRWTERPFLYVGYQDAELGYAVTDHAAQGRTVHTGLAVITGTEDRQHAYVVLTRGTEANLAYVFTVSPKRADPVPGPRPAPELARYDKIDAERAGQSVPVTQPALPGTALGVLSAVLENDALQISATQTWNQALADADHLAVLHAIWTAETTPARNQHYRDLLMNALPPGHRAEPGHQARWLWRTLRGAELGGLDPARVLAEAIAARDLAGSRDVPSVIDARIRCRLGSVVPLPSGSWSAQVPAIADRDRRAYAEQIAALMDAAKTGSASTPLSTPCLGRSTPSARHPRTPWTGWTGSSAPPLSVPGGNCPATTTPPTPSAPNPPRPPRTSGPPGMRPWPLNTPSTGPTSAACPTAGCCTCATPTPSRPPGPRHTSGTSSARSAQAPAKQTWPRPAPSPTPQPPNAPAIIRPPPGTGSWRPATGP